MYPRRKKDFVTFNLAFLDCISCGFGAVILLFVIFRGSHTKILEEVEEDLSGLLKERQEAFFEIRGETQRTNLEMEYQIDQLSEIEEQVAQLQRQLSEILGKYEASDARSQQKKLEKEALFKALQEIDLTRMPEQKVTNVVGGIPADSEYVLFVIDTSGSMEEYDDLVAKKIEETLYAFPQLKGLQILDADGNYLYPGSSGSWLPDSPSKRQEILARYLRWDNNSGSNPSLGIIQAINDFQATGDKISIFIFGDELATRDSTTFISIVENRNPDLPNGDQQFRIHAVGFPTNYAERDSGRNFSDVMRILAYRNGGSFVGIMDED
jgi:hypothetical protein